MADLYENFAALKAANVYGVDYHIFMSSRNSPVLYFAIHGGGIEGGSSELTMFAAGANDSAYCFEGFRSSNNGDLHITSTHFDEPNLLDFTQRHAILVSFHGYGDSANKHTKLGGMDTELREMIRQNLVQAGFSVEIEPTDSDIAGADPDNIVNKSSRGMGVQLEISTLQRSSFFGTNTRDERRHTTNAEFNSYLNAVKSAVADYRQLKGI
jgi:phage replication-related protein YjqB (UPF0714/DUF867 family)